jgi:MYXO-CTERM domain-containing protein
LRRLRLISLITLALLLGLSLPAASVASAVPTTSAPAGRQVWYFGSASSAPAFVMVKEATSSQTGSVQVNNGASVMWIANEVSQGVTFPSGDWLLSLATDAPWGTPGTACVVQIGRWSSTSGFSAFSVNHIFQGSWVESEAAHVLDLDIQTGSETVPSANYLAVRITNNSGNARLIYTGQGKLASSLTSPQTDPGYPLPELATGILLGAGLLGLGGFVLLRRRSQSVKKAL